MQHLIGALALSTAVALASASTGNAQSFGTPAPAASAPSTNDSSMLELSPKVGLQVTKLRRLSDKGVLQLEFTVTNNSDLDIALSRLGIATNLNLVNINLIDFANKRKYDMGESVGNCLCSHFGNVDGGLVKRGETKTFWAWFALPPAETKDMTILFADRTPLLNIQLQ